MRTPAAHIAVSRAGGRYLTWFADTQIYDNSIYRTPGSTRSYYGIKGREAKRTHIYNNTIEVSFAVELPFENDQDNEIDHNYLAGAVSIPKSAGGSVPASGVTFHINHNYFNTPYAIEFARNGVEIDHNLLDFLTTSDGGNLISDFDTVSAPGPAKFHDNLVKKPGRGVFWAQNPMNNLSFYNNHIITNTTITPRTDGLFGFNTSTNFSSIVIKDNIIECIGQSRPLVRKSASYAAIIENNTLTNVSDTANYTNANTGATRGPTAPINFTCGAYGEFTVNQWTLSATVVLVSPSADSFVRDGSYANSNYGTNTEIETKKNSGSGYNRQSFLKFSIASINSAARSSWSCPARWWDQPA